MTPLTMINIPKEGRCEVCILCSGVIMLGSWSTMIYRLLLDHQQNAPLVSSSHVPILGSQSFTKVDPQGRNRTWPRRPLVRCWENPTTKWMFHRVPCFIGGQSHIDIPQSSINPIPHIPSSPHQDPILNHHHHNPSNHWWSIWPAVDPREPPPEIWQSHSSFRSCRSAPHRGSETGPFPFRTPGAPQNPSPAYDVSILSEHCFQL